MSIEKLIFFLYYGCIINIVSFMFPIGHTVNNTRTLVPIVPNNYSVCEHCSLSFLFMSAELEIHQKNCVGPKDLWSKYFMNKGVVYLKTKQSVINNDEINIPSPQEMTKEVTKAMTYVTPPQAMTKDVAKAKTYVTSFLGFSPINQAKPVSTENPSHSKRPITPTEPVLIIDPNVRMVSVNLSDLVVEMEPSVASTNPTKYPVALPKPPFSSQMKKTAKSTKKTTGHEKWKSLLEVASSELDSF